MGEVDHTADAERQERHGQHQNCDDMYMRCPYGNQSEKVPERIGTLFEIRFVRATVDPFTFQQRDRVP